MESKTIDTVVSQPPLQLGVVVSFILASELERWLQLPRHVLKRKLFASTSNLFALILIWNVNNYGGNPTLTMHAKTNLQRKKIKLVFGYPRLLIQST